MPINSFLYPAPSTPTFAYNVANSLRFNGDNFLSRTNPSATSTNDKKGTFSFWIKRASFPNESQVLVHQADSSTKRFALQIANNDEFIFSIRNDAESVDIDGTTTLDRVYRDVAAWTNFVFNYDTSGGTNGCKLFVNGTEQALTYSNTLPQNFVMVQNTSSFANHTIGRDSTQSSNFWTGYMTEVMFVDGQQLAPTEFGEYDSDSPTIWKPKDITGINVGNLGYYLDFENSGALGTDAKGVGNFSTTNCAATDQSTDTCTNNFATMNPLVVNTSAESSFAEGNLQVSTTDSGVFGAVSTIGVSSGKWYWEVKPTQIENKNAIGVTAAASADAINNHRPGDGSYSAGIRSSGDAKLNGSSESGSWDSFTTSDIVGVALDLDNNKLYFSKNGTFMNSGDPTSGSTGTGAISLTEPASTTDGFYFFAFGDPGAGSGTANIAQFNFGSPPYSISSGNSDAEGFGNFEFSVPSGYFSLCTKNLAEYG